MRPRDWLWISMIVVLALVNFVVWGTGVGQCVDSITPGASYCSSSPSVGFPGAWAISAISAIVVGYCLYRLLRRPPA